MSTFKFTALLAATALAVLAVGCAPDDEPTDESEIVDNAQEELISTEIVVDGDDVVDGDTFDGARKDPQGESQQGFASPSDIRAEPVPHPWVPKTGKNDNDT